ncbi:MAG: penicillin-binding transpeptidase domain-containing protein [bacterium]
MKYKKEIEEDFLRTLPMAERLTIKREFIAAPAFVLCAIGLIVALFIVGVVKFPYYQAQAAQNRIARIKLPPPRGEILDRKGNPLAINHAVHDCYFITSDDVELDVDDLNKLGEFLLLNEKELERVISGRREAGSKRSMQSELWATGWGAFGARSILVKRDLNQVEVTSILERRTDFPHTFLERSYRRSYPAGASTAQVVGYMGEISEGELGESAPLGYRMGDMVGKGGLEKQYDSVMRGRDGFRLVSVDAHGRIRGEAEGVPGVVPEGGAVVVRGDEVAVLGEGDVADFSGRVRVSILSGITEAVETGYSVGESGEGAVQRTIFRDRGMGGEYGEWKVFRNPGEVAIVDGMVVMQPSLKPPSGGAPLNTTLDLDMQRAIDTLFADNVGGVVAMDPRDGSILAMVSKPGFDPNLFAPGGVDPTGWNAIMNDPHFPLLNRPVQNAYVPGSTFKIVTGVAAVNGGVAGSGQTWTCKGKIEVGKRLFRCWNRGGHGTVGFQTAIAESCDVAFWEIGQKLGYDPIANMARLMGCGEPTGIDLPGEKSGLIPSDEWKRNRFGQSERWFLGDTMNMAIGQGFLQLTVIQMVRITASVANGGYLVTPHLNRMLVSPHGTGNKIPVSPRAFEEVGAGMRQCVSDGTGKPCNLPWIRIAGKTGTADDPPRKAPHSWFTSYAPYENPTLVIVVFCENGGHKEEKAAAICAKFWNSDPVKAYLTEQ